VAAEVIDAEVIPREGVESESQNLTCYQILDLYVIPREGVESKTDPSGLGSKPEV